ncbi:hypothetical protein B4146_2855 [Bacillus subtilis]|nr:hypothetical protein B4146_2855 [Bacillus subtilis]
MQAFAKVLVKAAFITYFSHKIVARDKNTGYFRKIKTENRSQFISYPP